MRSRYPTRRPPVTWRRGGGAADRGPSASPDWSALWRNWARPSGNRREDPIFRGIPPAKVRIASGDALQRLELLAVLETDDVIVRHRFLNGHRGFRRFGRRDGHAGAHAHKRRMDVVDELRQVAGRHGIVAHVRGEYLSCEFDVVGGGHRVAHCSLLLAPKHMAQLARRAGHAGVPQKRKMAATDRVLHYIRVQLWTSIRPKNFLQSTN